MAELSWDTPGERLYEAGVDRGVLYLEDGKGVAWNGLISVNEASTGGETTPYFIDGVMYENVASAENFAASINAFTYPREFQDYDGYQEIHAGLYAGQQPRKPFGLSYRTKIGNDTDGLNHGYKIHIVYNAMATPAQRDFSTLTNEPNVPTFTWDITTMPIDILSVPILRRTAHMVIDTRRVPPFILTLIENALYGTNSVDAHILTPFELMLLFETILPGHYSIDPKPGTGLYVLIEGGGSDVQITEEPGMFGLTENTRLVPSGEGLYQLEV